MTSIYGLVIFLLLGIVPSIAPGNDASGTHPPGAAPSAQQEQTATQTPSDPTLTRSIAAYENQITELESAEGPHAEPLVEARSSLGMLYQQAGDHGQAIAVLRDALQSVRVNEGLHSMSQLAILEAIIDSQVALGARDELRRNYEYLFWLYQRNYGERNAGLVPVIKKLGQWYFDLYNFSPPNTTVEPLIAADDLYAKALKILPEDAPPRDRADILYKVAVINHHVAEDVQDPMLSHREIREAMIPHGRGSPYLNEAAVRQYYADQSFYKGKRSLKRLIETYEKTLPGGIMDYARALVFMGDWLTVQRRVLEGARLYQRALAALAEHDADPALVDELFGEPQPIEQLPIPGETEIASRRRQLLRGCPAGRTQIRLAHQHQDTGRPPARRNHPGQPRRTRHRRHPLPPPLPQRPTGRHQRRPPALRLQAQRPTRLAAFLNPPLSPSYRPGIGRYPATGIELTPQIEFRTPINWVHGCPELISSH